MAAPTYHITDAMSGVYGGNAFGSTGPGTLLMDADAWLVSPGSTFVFFDALTATINGRLTSSDFSGGGNAGIYVHNVNPGRTTITIGTTGEVTGYWGITADTQQPTDIINRGRIVSNGASGSAIGETYVAGNYKITNLGSIIASFRGIDLDTDATGGTGGIHTIINSGLIDAPVAIFSVAFVVEKVTNSGTIHGDIDLGAGADTFTNRGAVVGDVDLGSERDIFTDYVKVKVGRKYVVKHGSVDGTIDLGSGNDVFNGGNKAEKVQDGPGSDTYKLGGGNDTLLAASTTGSDGVDTIDGGGGRDRYDASAVTNFVLINLDKIAHGGIAASSVYAAGQTDRLLNFEDATGTYQGDTIYGNASANYLDGSAGDDRIFGLGGNDTINGGTGDVDHIWGGAGRDVMTGGNQISGSGGELGVYATNVFHFTSLSDSGKTAATRDVITDFISSHGPGVSIGGDYIDLSVIDAKPGTKGVNDAFTFIGATKWGHHAGELRYLWTATQTIVEADVNGDGKVDFSIALDGHHTLTTDDFVL